MEIDFINGRRTDEIFGISKYSSELRKRLESVSINTIEYPILAKGRLADGITKRCLYPAIVRLRMKAGNIKHITNQDLAFLLSLYRIQPSVISCHDLIPWTYYGQRSLFWKMNIKGLKKADEIITGSEFSKMQIMETTETKEERIHVIPDGVDHSQYFPNHDRSILSHYGIKDEQKVILYVGSEEPRKNLLLLLNSFVELKRRGFKVKLLKVGSPGFGISREDTLNQIRRLGILDDVIFTGFVPESMLPLYYNTADLFVFPSRIEGFGLPPLEAMACGCPVISSNTSSLPEVVGDGGILIDPDDNITLTNVMVQILTDEKYRKDLIKRGLYRASCYSWDLMAEKTIGVFKDLECRL